MKTYELMTFLCKGQFPQSQECPLRGSPIVVQYIVVQRSIKFGIAANEGSHEIIQCVTHCPYVAFCLSTSMHVHVHACTCTVPGARATGTVCTYMYSHMYMYV